MLCGSMCWVNLACALPPASGVWILTAAGNLEVFSSQSLGSSCSGIDVLPEGRVQCMSSLAQLAPVCCFLLAELGQKVVD